MILQTPYHGTMTSPPFKISNWLETGALFGSSQCGYQLSMGPFCRNDEPVNTGKNHYSFESFFGQDLNKQYWKTGESDHFFGHQEMAEQLSGVTTSSRRIFWREPPFEGFRDKFYEANVYFKKGSLKKIVPIVFEEASVTVTAQMLSEWLAAALSRQAQGNLFGIWDLKKGEGILGLTPEKLFSKNENVVETMALAGTQVFEGHDLMSDLKERKEHRIVVDSLIQSLERFGDVEVGETREWQPSSLKHLRTDLRLITSASDQELLKQLHPTPALGGDPQKKALEVLQAWDQNILREGFGAPFGWTSGPSESCYVVAIRCLIWKAGQLRLGSGCGIVAESQLETEWNELKIKRQSVKEIFGIL